jgi:hypothetical protein
MICDQCIFVQAAEVGSSSQNVLAGVGGLALSSQKYHAVNADAD